MCKVRNGHDYTKDAEVEAGMGERGEDVGSNGWRSRKQLILVVVLPILGVLMGLFAAPFFYNVRGVASLQVRVDHLQTSVDKILEWESTEHEQLQILRERVLENPAELAVGERYTLEEELLYRQTHQMQEADKHSALRERLAILEYKNGITQ